jgi:RNA polymerase sigma-70 factor, ECF subfamily
VALLRATSVVSPTLPRTTTRTERDGGAWLEAFHRGEGACLDACYREWFPAVDRAVGDILHGADRETVVHEVFFRLLSDARLRRSFAGGSFGAWLRVVARNQAIDCARRRRMEVGLRDEAAHEAAPDPAAAADRLQEEAEARLTVEAFRATCLPRKWEAVFVARFLDQQDQPTAARTLGMSRTTLAYQEPPSACSSQPRCFRACGRCRWPARSRQGGRRGRRGRRRCRGYSG